MAPGVGTSPSRLDTTGAAWAGGALQVSRSQGRPPPRPPWSCVADEHTCQIANLPPCLGTRALQKHPSDAMQAAAMLLC